MLPDTEAWREIVSCLSYTDIFKLRHNNLRVLEKNSRHYYIIGGFPGG